MTKPVYNKLRLILGDQLNASHSWFQSKEKDTLYLIAELHQEATYTQHHVQKICAFFAAMAAFANALSKAGFQVCHLTLDETKDYATFPDLLSDLIQTHSISQFEYQRPDEFRLLAQLRALKLPEGVSVQEADTEHFLLPFDEITQHFSRDKHVLMEHFYRMMRKRFSVLMDGKQPEGGKWNYDKENRLKLQPEDLAAIPEPLRFENDVSDILKRLNQHQIPHFGTPATHLLWPVSRTQARTLLDYFCAHQLIHFGQFQDAMTCQSEHQWSLYHSRLSFAINTKMLHPMQVIQAVLNRYDDAKGEISLAQVEGFIRQILGWREYVRGVYWANMPGYASHNTLSASRNLPAFFWHGQTGMNCLKSAITQSLDYAYAHHIQRLMVTGNFCLLTGIDPDQVDAWYLGIYVDAIEWVEMPNTRGMSQFADNGIIATKPYAASGNYIHKMSDYCQSCQYSVKKKTGDDACPLNSLYWRFLDLHQQRFAVNPRIGMIYRSWDNQSEAQRQAVLERAEYCLANLDKL
ncbi:cryptochrome/photolyase family protein [Photobacterium sp. 1_MG-2023]|uniref:cryptochrome/photolyase family protein n=1 Tax=Photobacterium sp. 1_MG-2023 TaxID=3062646 RepID=UPI0026E44FBD|nr:cryptochrome/photolyase family protein [Photobacterium sp. 1_MG-2023]MDO6706926.1 cryptochrome/photolyase family protein [Photobacterium sp. 1_MG-2023]